MFPVFYDTKKWESCSCNWLPSGFNPKKQLQKELWPQQEEKKRSIIKSVIETQEKERRKLSVELHDNVNQILASCKLLLEAANDSVENALLLNGKIYKGIDTAIRELRKISHDLNPSALDDLGLVGAINEMMENINLTGKIRAQFFPDHKSYSDILRKEDRIAVYRIIQEQVTNIVKHANADAIMVTLRTVADKIYLSIEDNGRGFDLQATKKGIGLKSIQNRVDYYQGTMEVDSDMGKRCSLKIMLNLKEPEA